MWQSLPEGKHLKNHVNLHVSPGTAWVHEDADMDEHQLSGEVKIHKVSSYGGDSPGAAG